MPIKTKPLNLQVDPDLNVMILGRFESLETNYGSDDALLVTRSLRPEYDLIAIQIINCDVIIFDQFGLLLGFLF